MPEKPFNSPFRESSYSSLLKASVAKYWELNPSTLALGRQTFSEVTCIPLRIVISKDWPWVWDMKVQPSCLELEID